MTIVPVNIRPHLVPFFFKESDGKEYRYANRVVKTVFYSSSTTTIGKIIRLLMVKSNMPLKVDDFNLCLSVEEVCHKKKYEGTIYRYESGRNHFLKLPEDANNDINDLMEDMFKMAFVKFIDGCLHDNPKANVVKAIDKFIDDYDLLEFDKTNETMRRLYYREKKKQGCLVRFHNHNRPKDIKTSLSKPEFPEDRIENYNLFDTSPVKHVTA